MKVSINTLTNKAPITLAADDTIRQSQLQQTTVLNMFYCFSEKIRLETRRESSAG